LIASGWLPPDVASFMNISGAKSKNDALQIGSTKIEPGFCAFAAMAVNIMLRVKEPAVTPL
jgi:hypothetical protein